MSLENLLSESLGQRDNAILDKLHRSLVAAFPGKTVFRTDDSSFNIHEFTGDGHCSLREKEDFLNSITHYWFNSKDTFKEDLLSWYEVGWQGKQINVVTIKINQSGCQTCAHFLIADSQEIASDFFKAVCAWCMEVRGEVLVFSDGFWQKSTNLYQSIQSSTLDNLVLPGTMKEDIVQDFEQFFQSEEIYAKHKIPWKRGVILLGPPGNGKTHMVKALVNYLKRPCLYVRSFESQHTGEFAAISAAFNRARENAPCLFILEDLDSLLNDKNRSFFLNEMDGFADNHGILTIATANHPEKLDPAIIDRPSRFDRKYHFELPERAERRRFLEMANQQLEEPLRATEWGLDCVADDTEDFSYAYLKELVLSSMMKWIASPEPGKMDQVMVAQAANLRNQMTAAIEEEDEEPEVPEESEEEHEEDED